MTSEGVELEADTRHVEIAVRDLKLEHARPSRVPGSKPTKGCKDKDCGSVEDYDGRDEDENGQNETSVMKMRRRKTKIPI